MPSNLYLFDPSAVSRNSADKPLSRIVREAELARAEASARIARNAIRRIASLFRAKKPVDTAAPANANAAPAENPRLAA